MAMNYKRIWLGLALLAVGVIGCNPLPGDAGGFAAGGNYASNGQRIYFTGASANDRITYTWEGPGRGMMGGQGGMMGGQGGMMSGLACVTCHGSDGRGRQNVMNSGVNAPDIRWSTLTEAEHDQHGDDEPDMDHPPYTVETFKRAVTQGLDPGGNSLDPVMPRWQMSDQDLNDLIDFLKTLN
jgi:cytochrome c oxidase subunit 2